MILSAIVLILILFLVIIIALCITIMFIVIAIIETLFWFMAAIMVYSIYKVGSYLAEWINALVRWAQR